MEQPKNWSELQKLFMAITQTAGGPSKISSGTIAVHFGSSEIEVVMGSYDIGDWPRHLIVGLFVSEDAAKLALEKKIDEAMEVVRLEEQS